MRKQFCVKLQCFYLGYISLQRHLFGVIEGDYAVCMSLCHGYELLLQHGMRSVKSYLESVLSGDKSNARTRTELMKNAEFVELLALLKDKYQPTRLGYSFNVILRFVQ